MGVTFDCDDFQQLNLPVIVRVLSFMSSITVITSFDCSESPH